MKKIKTYSYTILLAASFFVVFVAWQAGYLALAKGTEEMVSSLTDGFKENEFQALTGRELESDVAIGRLTSKEEPIEEEPVKEEPVGRLEPEISVFYQADTSYFQDALFIGDSRTVGLSEYGNLGEAEVFADSGMNLYVIYKKELRTASGEKKKLEEVLKERQFGKIYLMLGINELGYSYEKTIARYQELLERMRELQPSAIFFLEANLHISQRKSESSEVYNNEGINRFNHAVEQLADERTSFYIDVNEIFDDEEGNLDEKYTADDAHVLGKYYADWVDWILTKAVRTPGKP